MQANDLVRRQAVIEEFYKYIGSEFMVDDVELIEKIILGIPGSISLDDGMDYCEIIQSICPYSHGCSTCRLHSDYEKAKEKSAELMKKKECTL